MSVGEVFVEVSGGAFDESLSEDILKHSRVGDVESREASPDRSTGRCTPPNYRDHVSRG